MDGNKAAIQTESEVRASEDEVLAIRIDTQTARIDDNAAAIQTESEVRATEDEALASQITTLAAEVGENSAAIQTESEVRASEDEALASRITDVQVEFEGEFAGIRDEMTVIINDQEALAQRVGTVELDLDDTKGAIEQRMTVIEDDIDGIRAEYTVKLEIEDEDGNSYVGGFGLVNDGDTIMALWRVDVFAVGQPGCDSLTFAIDTEENRVVMDGALIKNASINTAQVGELDVERLTGDTAHFVNANITNGSITNAKIGNVIQSNNYVAGKSGWILNKAGLLECHQIFARGQIEGSIIRGSVIEGGMLIQSDIQITTPTEADRGAGTIRYLSVSSTAEQVAARDGAANSLTTPILGIVTANYTAEGYEDYGDGDLKEPVYVNLNRYIPYLIKPEMTMDFGLLRRTSKDGGYLSFRFEIIGVKYNNTEVTLFKSSDVSIGGRGSSWIYGNNQYGDWAARIRRSDDCSEGSTGCGWYVYQFMEGKMEVNKISFTYRDGSYKGIKGRCVAEIFPQNDHVKNVTIKDTLSNYL